MGNVSELITRALSSGGAAFEPTGSSGTGYWAGLYGVGLLKLGTG